MVLVSGTPRFPDELRTVARQFTREAFGQLSRAELEALRARHVHGDEQILKLYDMTRSFATSDDDMAFTSASLATITARTLIVHGDRDPLYVSGLAVELFRGIPRSALWIIPNGGHGPDLWRASRDLPNGGVVALTGIAVRFEDDFLLTHRRGRACDHTTDLVGRREAGRQRAVRDDAVESIRGFGT